MNAITMRRAIIVAGVLLLIGGGIAFLVVTLQSRSANANKSVNIDISAADNIADQIIHQQGSQEGDAALYERYIKQLTLGRLGREQPTTDDEGRVIYHKEDQLTYSLVTTDSTTAPFKIRYEIVDDSEARVQTGEPLDINPGANTSCCIVVPQDSGKYTLRFTLDEQLFAARYFVVK